MGVPKPHAVFVPFPLSTHINSMLKFAKILHHKGFHITFINSEFHHNTILSSKGPNALDGLPDFRFEKIPVDIPSTYTDAAKYFLTIRESIRNNFMSPFHDLLAKLNDTPTSKVPSVTCIVSDGAFTHTITAAEQLGIPLVLFWVTGASGFLSITRHRDLIRRCFTTTEDDSKERDAALDTTTDFVPGRKGIRMRDLLSSMQTAISKEYIIDTSVGEANRTSKASAIIIFTCEALEKNALNELSSMFGRVYSIAPLSLLLNQVSYHGLNLAGNNIWPGETACVEWLNSKEPESVLYVCFGSTTVVTSEQIIEFAWGLANSNQNFLWIIRSDMINGESTVLPLEFLEEIKERGLISSWCEQEQVLNHPAVGGFLTHCGWNSVLEAICAGVPMICWPFFSEQTTSSTEICNNWGLGIEIDKDVRRGQVEEVVRELMEGEKGNKIKEKAREWKKMAEEAAGPLGSSSRNLDKLVNEVLVMKP